MIKPKKINPRFKPGNLYITNQDLSFYCVEDKYDSFKNLKNHFENYRCSLICKKSNSILLCVECFKVEEDPSFCVFFLTENGKILFDIYHTGFFFEKRFKLLSSYKNK